VRLPRDGKAVTAAGNDKDHALMLIATELRNLVLSLRKASQ
jgi:hypothetical protein